MAKVICVDNFNREDVSDRLVEEGMTQSAAERKAKELNEKFGGEDSPCFYRVVPDDHKLYVFDPT